MMRTTLLLTVVGCGCPGCVSGCVCVWGVCVWGGVCPGVWVSMGEGGCPGCVCVQVCVYVCVYVCVCVSGYHTDTPITIKAEAIP